MNRICHELQIHSTLYVLCYYYLGDAPKHIPNTDVSAPLLAHNDNRCDTDVSLSDRLQLWWRRHVRQHHFFSYLVLTFSGDSKSAPDLLQNYGTKVSKLRWNQPPRSQLEVIVDTSYEQSRMSRPSHHDPYISMGGQPCEKSHGLSLKRDPENPMENQVPV